VARDAATVILARDAGGDVEVLLLERHRASPMAPGAYAFPGGRVEVADAGPAWEPLCRGLTLAAAAAILPDVEPPTRAIGFWVAALREAFEEAAILLAYDRAGQLLGRHGLTGARGAAADAAPFRRLLAAEGLVLATDRMAYWAHWITPEERPVRYDTRFFVAAAPPDATAEPDGTEIVGARWLTPADALGCHRAGELTLPAVTREILASVSPYPSAAALLAAAAGRAIRPIRPRIVLAEGKERILLPDDPGWY
jgi:8-oxo-dGTP pyrophosphatase MutT (NUDIX family)